MSDSLTTEQLALYHHSSEIEKNRRWLPHEIWTREACWKCDFFRVPDVLYIGAAIDQFSLSWELQYFNVDTTVLEVWPENVEWLRQQKWIKQVIEADVTKFKPSNGEQWSGVMWLHGPEHLQAEDIEPTVKMLEGLATKIIMIGCPLGDNPRHTPELPYQSHHSTIDPNFFMELGYRVYFHPGWEKGKHPAGQVAIKQIAPID